MTTNRHERGQALIQAIIAIGIVAILAVAMASMFSSQNRESQALSEKMASSDLERVLITSLADGGVCRYLVNDPTNLTFDSTHVSAAHPQIITPTHPLYSSVNLGPPVVTGPVIAQVGSPASAYSSSAIVQSIVLSISGAPSPLPPPGPGATFTGNWLVTLNPSRLARALKPISATVTITADTTTPGAARITGCQGSSGGTISVIQVTSTGNWVHNANGAYYASSTSTCPSGYVANGGGAGCEANSGYAAMIYSVPNSTTGFYGSCVNWGPGAAGTSVSGYGVKTYAYCLSTASTASGSLRQVTATFNWVHNANGAYYAGGAAVCPAGYASVGGGGGCEADSGYAAMIYSNPSGINAYYSSCVNWGPGAAGTSTSGYGIKVYAYCIAQ